MKHISLTNWTVAGFWPWTPLFGKSMETGFAMSGVTPAVPARVPGSVYDDLLRAGLIDDPDIGLNSLNCEWVANRWWVYECRFATPEKTGDERSVLVFDGIDYEAIIFFNGRQIAEHTGMYTQCRVDITDCFKTEGENLLLVVIKHAPDEMGQIGYTSRTHTQKARYNYKWDFSTRLVNLGLYGAVRIEQKGRCELCHPHLRVVDAKGGKVAFSAAVAAACDTAAELTVAVTAPDGSEAASLSRSLDLRQGENEVSGELTVADPQLWWPNGYGDQPLYTVHVTVTDDGGSDGYDCRIGLREITYEQCDGAREDSLPYLIRVNGRRIYIKGTNMTPLDMLYGCVTRADYARMIGDVVRGGNVNLLRVWGGGLIETETFYDLCDENGILVWQEFIQSSSGIDNVPSEIPEFLELLYQTVTAAVYGRRNHPSLAIWGGGNELMSAPNKPVGYDNPNIAGIKAITDRLDPDRLLLPTSASGPIEFLNVDNKGANHDVHGPWNYGGPVDHYRMYNASDSQLHSEFGCNGMSSERTIRHICGPAHLGVLDNGDYVWRHHGEWWNALPRDTEVVGAPRDMTEMIKIDQFIQAESIRYSVESNARRAFQNCGSIIWVLNEPWPNVANCSMVDHYFDKKLSYKLVGEAFSPLHASLKYDSLYLSAGQTFAGEIWLHSDRPEQTPVSLRWIAREVGGDLLDEGHASLTLACGDRKAVGTLCFEGTGKPIEIVLRLTAGEETRENRYLFLTHAGTPDSDERRADIDAVVAFFDAADDWALKA